MPELTIQYNLSLCPLQSRLQHIYHGQVPMPELALSPSQGLWIWPLNMFTLLMLPSLFSTPPPTPKRATFPLRQHACAHAVLVHTSVQLFLREPKA
jgi:hypothetical protein